MKPRMECSYASLTTTISAPEYKTDCPLYKPPNTRLKTDPFRSQSQVRDEKLKDLLGEAKFYSLTYRLFKLPPGRLETLCEDYGQYAVYKGTIEGNKNAYVLDDHHRLEKNKPFLVCGNTAAMLGETWLGKHFEIVGDRSTHFGLFDCGPSPVAWAGAGNAPVGGACC